MENRTIKELLQLTRDQLIANKEVVSICFTIFHLYGDNYITYDEWQQLRIHINNNLPSRNYPKQPGFKWKPGTKACRIKWLTKQINSL